MNFSKKTIETYQSLLTKFDGISFSDIDRIIEVLDNKTNTKNSRYTNLQAIMHKLKENKQDDLLSKYREIADSLKKEIHLDEDSNELSAREKKSFVDWDEILRIKQKIFNGENLKELSISNCWDSGPLHK
jgi:hypothetical protein